MLILQQHLTLVTTINTQGGEKKAIDRSAWLLLLHCFPGSLSEQWLSSCTSQAGTDPRGCLQSSMRAGREEQDDREVNTAVKWHWLPARIQNRSLRAKGCWERLILSSSLSYTQALGTPLRGGQQDMRTTTVLWELYPISEAELAFKLWCYKVFIFYKITKKGAFWEYSCLFCINTAPNASLHSLRAQNHCCNTELLQNTMNLMIW